VDSGHSGLIVADPADGRLSSEAGRLLFLSTNPRVALGVAISRVPCLPAPVVSSTAIYAAPPLAMIKLWRRFITTGMGKLLSGQTYRQPEATDTVMSGCGPKRLRQLPQQVGLFHPDFRKGRQQMLKIATFQNRTF
jgi:hypothetical protein